MIQMKAFKFRIYPNQTQKEIIEKSFGCSRFVYNHMLALQKEKYENESESYSKYDLIKKLPSLKKNMNGANQRKDYLHQISTKLIRENQIICLEDLKVSNMIKNHKLASAIQGYKCQYKYTKRRIKISGDGTALRAYECLVQKYYRIGISTFKYYQR